jgi:hypothetical protein
MLNICIDFLESENHLKQNILKQKQNSLKDLSSRSFHNNMFTHTLSVELQIATSRLSDTFRELLKKVNGKETMGL